MLKFFLFCKKEQYNFFFLNILSYILYFSVFFLKISGLIIITF